MSALVPLEKTRHKSKMLCLGRGHYLYFFTEVGNFLELL